MKTKLIIFALLVTTITGCTRETCPGFPEHLVDYFPYQNGNTLKFVNQENDTLFFSIRDFWWDKKQTYRSCDKCKCSGQTSLQFLAVSREYHNNDSISMISGSMVVSTQTQEVSIFCEIMSWGEDYIWNFNTGYDQFSKIVADKDAFNPNDAVLFGDTVILTNENTIRINRVVIVKGEGITEFFDTKRNCLWAKIN